MNRNPLLPGDDGEPRQSDSLNDSAAETSPTSPAPTPGSRLAEFERVYRGQFGAVVSYFARRYEDPQLVADLTADTFVAAIRAFASYDARATTPRAWAIGIARKVWVRYRSSDPRGEDPARRRSLDRLLDRAEAKELRWWIDVERASGDLTERLARLSELEREAVELVDLCELTPAEAAHELSITQASLRVRLMRGRGRLRRDEGDDA